jgi:osmotically-inducible protein OsmY
MQTTSNDKSTRDSVIRELEWDPRVHTDHIGVAASDGAIVLSGHVPSYSDRWAAVRADELEIKLSQSSVRNDEDIAEDISRHMHLNTAIPAGIKADVIKGHVTLHGEVRWVYERDEAARAIRYLAGVHNLSNTITIKPHVPKAADVGHRVSEAIERMADLDARSIRVTATDGTVHLQGVVHSFAERRTAGFAAAAAPGVTDVANEILVTP